MTDTEIVGRADFPEQAARALQAGGADCALQLRARGLGSRALHALAARLAEAARSTGAELWVNGRVDVALAVRADGVQLGGDAIRTADARGLLGAQPWIGRSVHGVAEAGAALAEGADLVVLGAIYPTSSHPGRRALGPRVLEAPGLAGRPILAIGGITPQRTTEVVRAGAWGVAVRSGLWEAPDVASAAARYREALESARSANEGDGEDD